MMKKVYLIGGTMGVGKTTVCQKLKLALPNSVFLDGDWCWDASPFQVTDETKAMGIVMWNVYHSLQMKIICVIDCLKMWKRAFAVKRLLNEV